MRILILDTLYREFIDSVYAREPELAARSSAEQLEAIYRYGFSRCDFLPINLRRLGHEAHQIIVNAPLAQRAAAAELGVRQPALRGTWSTTAQRATSRLRTAMGMNRAPGDGDALRLIAAQVDRFDPELIFVADVLQFSSSFLQSIKRGRILLGECAYPVPDFFNLGAYDLMVSAVPHFVARFAAAGIPTALWHHAFEPSVLSRLEQQPSRKEVIFLGSVSRNHSERRMLLEEVARAMPVEFIGNASRLPPWSGLRRKFRPPLWGYDMYCELQRSRIALNVHIDMASRYAANIRMYEATGVGTMLLTDWKENLGELFVIGEEVVAFRDARECVELAEYYLAHEEERAAIAAAGQRRTLRDHTYRRRADELMRFVGGQLTHAGR